MNSHSVDCWSRSDTDQFARCEQWWYFRKVEGLIIPPGFSAHRGGAVHVAERVDMQRKMDMETGIEIEEMQDIAASEFERRVRMEGVFVPSNEEADTQTLFGKEKDRAVRAAALYGTEVSPLISKPRAVEQTLMLDLPFLPVPLTATVDLVYQQNGGAMISDLKTKTRRPTVAEAHQQLQPVFYKLLWEQTQLESAAFEYHYLITTSKESLTETIRRTVEETETVALLARIHQQLETIQRGDFRGASPGVWWCSRNWCGYWDICPWVRKGVVT